MSVWAPGSAQAVRGGLEPRPTKTGVEHGPGLKGGRPSSPAARGIGRAIADLLADEGCDVAVCARNAEQVAQAVAELEAKGVEAFGQAVDIADGPALGFVKAASEALEGGST